MKHPSASTLWLALVSAAFGSQLRAQEQASPPPEEPVMFTPLPPGKGLQWRFGDTTLKLGGFVKLDLIHDFDAIGSEDLFDPRTIPTDGSDGTNTRLHARQSRLNLDWRGAYSTDPWRVFVEGDFFGDNSSFRMRHAYGELGSVLAGQTWTTFMDDDAMPETLDCESPTGFPQIRQAQVRYTKTLEGGNSFAISVEDPQSDIVPPTGVPGHSEEVLPDFNAHYNWKHSRGHVQIGGFGGMSSFRPDNGSSDEVALWGVNLSTKFMTTEKDNLILQVTYGDGVGRYRGGITAAPDSSGDLEAVTTTALLGSYEHHWSDEYRSTIMYSWADGDLPSGSAPTSTETLQYLAANLIWQFSPRAWTGVEYLYGTNDTFDGNDGDASRAQFSIRVNL